MCILTIEGTAMTNIRLYLTSPDGRIFATDEKNILLDCRRDCLEKLINDKQYRTEYSPFLLNPGEKVTVRAAPGEQEVTRMEFASRTILDVRFIKLADYEGIVGKYLEEEKQRHEKVQPLLTKVHDEQLVLEERIKEINDKVKEEIAKIPEVVEMKQRLQVYFR
jgi:hypothetical protein